jgi:hypothetical protein
MKKHFIALALVTAVAIGAASAFGADSQFLKKFKDDYATLDLDLLNNQVEFAQIKDFVYQKDIATFTFTEGRLFLLRYVNDRPTTVIFIGKGSAQINIPSHVERQCLIYASHDSTVNEPFEVCFMRIGDNFDLRLKEKFTFAKQQLDWKDFNIAKKAQGEYFFRPNIAHEYDNYFQLLRSVYERADDGYFWVDFNRYVYSFDPNRPEQSIVAYEKEGGAEQVTEGAVQQRKERGITDDMQMSDIAYPTTMVDRQAYLVMTGMDGRDIDTADARVRVAINVDSLKFLSIFLHYNLKLDSLYVNGAPVDYMRRKDFNFIGAILPKYAHKGDTLDVRMWYHGTRYLSSLPWVENPSPTKWSLKFNVRAGYNYVMPGVDSTGTPSKGRVIFTVNPEQTYRDFFFQGYASGYDTIKSVSEVGITLNFLKSRAMDKNRYNCFVPDDLYQSAILDAFNFDCSQIGTPSSVFDLTLFPDPDAYVSMPGIQAVTQAHCLVDQTGGFQLVAGKRIGEQYFGSLLHPQSDRDSWLAAGASEYLGLLYVDHALKNGEFYTELLHRRTFIDSAMINERDLPLACGTRVDDSLKAYKGAWLFHMLRLLMFDIDKNTDATFWKFMRELSWTGNNREYTNADIIKLAEKHYGKPLDWFFKQWLFGRNFPTYKVEYSIVPKDNQFVIKGIVATSGVEPTFSMPVLRNVESDGGQSVMIRQTISGPQASFELGPFPTKPKTMTLNAGLSVLSNLDVKQK